MADLTSNTDGLQEVLDMIDSRIVDTSQFQPKDADLTAIAGLTGANGFLKKTAAGAWALDGNSYLPLSNGELIETLVFNCQFDSDSIPHIQSKQDLILQAGTDHTSTNIICCFNDLDLGYNNKNLLLGQQSQIIFEGVSKNPRIKYNATYDAIEFVWS